MIKKDEQLNFHNTNTSCGYESNVCLKLFLHIFTCKETFIKQTLLYHTDFSITYIRSEHKQKTFPKTFDPFFTHETTFTEWNLLQYLIIKRKNKFTMNFSGLKYDIWAENWCIFETFKINLPIKPLSLITLWFFLLSNKTPENM